MNLTEAEQLIWKTHCNSNDPRKALKQAIIAIHDSAQDDCEQKYTKQIQQLEKQVAYWKLSFHKQIEAQRKE